MSDTARKPKMKDLHWPQLMTCSVLIGTVLFAAVVLGSSLPAFGDQAEKITAREASARMTNGTLTLVDIRAPAEWRKTGVARGAALITMHQDDERFLARLRALIARTPGRAIGIICAAGGRSAGMQRTLSALGIMTVDVFDGMLGGFDQPGWIRSGLPLRRLR